MKLLLAIAYIITSSVGGLAIAWLLLDSPYALVISVASAIFWPFFILETFKLPREQPVFTGQVDHPGAGIGVLLALVLYLTYQLNFLILLLGVVGFGVLFSLLSEWAQFTCQSWRWRSRSGDSED